MNIAIIGVGGMGSTLARRLVPLGHHVQIASARGPTALAEVATELGARAVSVAEAGRGSDVIILAVPTKAIPALPASLFSDAPDHAVIVDIGNYHPALRDGRITAIEDGMLDSQWIARQIGRPVVKAFNTLFARSLLEKGTPKGSPRRIALPVAGDSSVNRALVRELVEELGFDSIDAGTLDDSWRQATGTPAYCKDLDAEALRRALAAAQRDRIAEYRAEEERRIERALASPPG